MCDDFVIIDKPSGLASQPGEGVGICVLDAVERDFGFKPYLVHRLDKETSGCLLVARSPRAAADLSALLGGGGAVKTYRLVAFGQPEPAEGVFTAQVRDKERLLKAETRYCTLASDGRLSLIEASLGTGRKHQIRQHFAQGGHPIVADDRHGDFRRNKAMAKEFGVKRLLLYASYLYLPLVPAVEANASVPPHFKAFLERWGRGGATC